jgi:hypothetical protein
MQHLCSTLCSPLSSAFMHLHTITVRAAGVSVTGLLALESPARHQQGHCLLPSQIARNAHA